MNDNTAMGRGGENMKISIFQIKVKDGRREVDPGAVYELADSISKVGLLNPITIDQDYALIAGLHRLEAAKRLGWLEIECTVKNLDGLLAQLAEIDENLVRRGPDCIAQGELLNKRKEIYEALNPETKVGISQANGMNFAVGNNVSAPSALTSKSFVRDTSEKTGISKRTIEENLQLARDLTPKAKQTIQSANEKVKKKDMLKLSRLTPEQQEEVASQLAAGTIRSVDEYHPSPAEMCWVEAFRSEKRPVHFLRIFIESRDYARYEKAVQEICTSMNKRDNADYYTILFLNGRFREVLEDGMNAREALGWSYTFMKKGLRLFLLYLYRGDELPAGLRRMRDGAAGDMAFSEENYCQGLECRQERKDSDLFWKCFCEWKARTVMPEDEQQKVMERLESLIEMRVDGIMGANRRKYYGECAAFIAACGEVKESWGERMGKQSFMDSHRQRYPRRSAFKQELQDLGYRG